ncbi:hypothetical protein J4218_04730 [Candidatus Pacearchaeota archaeon]|nr:hypothetical protein [Candidatus Pacearchaeota archaeon]
MAFEDPIHQENIRKLILRFGQDKESHITSRYTHQYHIAEEIPGLNGKLPDYVYHRTKETLEVEFSTY